jgi:outer membrane protein assembly factor BamB
MKTTNPTTGVLVGCVLLLCGAGLFAQDWPQWRGPNRDAKATGFTAPATWPKQLTKKWSVTVGGGDASPSLVGDKLYVFTREGGDEVIRCLDAASGKELWQDKYAAKPASTPGGKPHEGPRSSPTVVDGKVVTLGASGTLSCLDAATGKMLWRKDDFKSWPQFYISSSPIVENGLCIAQLGGSRNGALVAYDLATGDEKWKLTGESPAYASPVLLTAGDTKLIVAETKSKLVAVNAADGKLAWEAPCTTRYNASTPVTDGQTVIYDSGRGEKAVKLEKQGDSFVAKDLWNNTENSVIYNTPVVKDGLLYGLTQSHKFFCINTQTGKTMWTAPAPQAGGAPPGAGGAGGGGGGRRMGGGGRTSGYGSIVDAGSVLVALTPASQLVVFEPNEKEFKQVASYKVADKPTYSYPILSGNRIYVKDEETVTLWTID